MSNEVAIATNGAAYLPKEQRRIVAYLDGLPPIGCFAIDRRRSTHCGSYPHRRLGTSPKYDMKTWVNKFTFVVGFGGGREGVALLPSILDKAFKFEL